MVGFSSRNHPQQTRKRGRDDATDDRRTPADLFDTLHAEFAFALDVAASAENAKCARYFDSASDGLSSSWENAVWCNPPYSDIRPWVEKAWAEAPRCRAIVMLLPANRTEQWWWQELIEPGRRDGRLEVRFLPGRIRFDRPGWTKPAKGDRPPFGLCLVIWRMWAPLVDSANALRLRRR